MVSRRHHGPLLIQRPLYPEGPGVCQTIILHPPGGVAGADRLDIRLDAGPGSHGQITTPGASRWYRTLGDEAFQSVSIKVDGGILEWLPLETIVFDGAKAQMRFEVDLHRDGRYLGWEILCLGRTASGERFLQGSLRRNTIIRQDGRLLWNERNRLVGGEALLSSPVGLGGCTVIGTLLLAGRPIGEASLAAARGAAATIPSLHGAGAQSGVSVLPNLLVAHYLGHSSEAARRHLEDLWRVLRPLEFGLEAKSPRIWST